MVCISPCRWFGTPHSQDHSKPVDILHMNQFFYLYPGNHQSLQHLKCLLHPPSNLSSAKTRSRKFTAITNWRSLAGCFYSGGGKEVFPHLVLYLPLFCFFSCKMLHHVAKHFYIFYICPGSRHLGNPASHLSSPNCFWECQQLTNHFWNLTNQSNYDKTDQSYQSSDKQGFSLDPEDDCHLLLKYQSSTTATYFFQDYRHPDDHTRWTTDNPEFKTFNFNLYYLENSIVISLKFHNDNA